MDDTPWKQSASGLNIGIYGWRKRCLYLVMLSLIFVTTLNLTLVLWLTKVLQFNTSGLSYMQVVGSGIQFSGKTFIQDHLIASGFFTRRGQVMSVKSSNNLTLRTTDHAGYVASNILLGNGKFEVNTANFKVTDPRGKILFSADKDTVSLTADSLYISGEGGAVLEGTLQTPTLSADIRSDLSLEAVTKGVQAATQSGVSIESRAGDILASGHLGISLITVDGSIKLESENVLMPTLRHQHLRKHLLRHSVDRIYQLCACDNGDLFLGDPDAFCHSSMNSDICR